ncbi:Polysaccharide accessory transport protein [Neorhizobium galegae bv. orientalis]|uniref:Polysaccharide accessory transport protein n=2 Tax=Neorhizobium galegae TaxID=399 RepID=A0A068SUS5_NEOGA|nr:GumC family protein [Neorhizobium galegae]CDN49506.1 Polysaccharide accessory transport protein [Neorhizobium galegae bv. orientalis str. HAMBI 540]CDZ47011.1 Polysaccharide accessory transport protein [Neorhizobium galegae bv. orientalis]
MYEPKEPHTRRSASARALRYRSDYQSSLLNHPLLEEEEPEEQPPARHQPRPSSAPDYRPRSDYHRDPPAYEREDDDRMRYEDIPFEKRIEAQLHSLTEIQFTDIIRWLRKGFLRIIAAAILGAVLALLYAAIASPRYTVGTEIIIDPSNLNVVSDDVFSANPQRDSQLLEVESKLRVLTSRNVLTKVINDLNLTEDPEFNRPGRLDGLRNLISSPSARENRQLSVLRQLEKQVTATRDDGSFVVVLSVWTGDVDKSIKLSNAIVSAFEGELFKSSSASAGQLAIGLNSRLDELRRSVTQAEEKVEQFKRQNDLQSTAGELTSTRISGALDTQVLDAQQRLIQADTRYKQLQAAYADRRVANSAVFDSATMITLRASYSALQQQISSMTLVYGTRHPRLVALQSELASVDRAISEEAARLLQSAKTDVDQANNALQELRRKSDASRSTVFTENDAQVRLRELERDARSKAAVYETYLSRTHQISERQQIDTSNVRVISPPVPPQSKSWPPSSLLLMIGGAFAGAIFGVLMALTFGLFGHMREAGREFA